MTTPFVKKDDDIDVHMVLHTLSQYMFSILFLKWMEFHHHTLLLSGESDE